MMEDAGIPYSKKDEYNLDHIQPLTAGGDNSRKNLHLIPKSLHKTYTPLDIMLGKAVRSKEISRRKAGSLSKKLKTNKMTIPEYLEELDNAKKKKQP